MLRMTASACSGVLHPCSPVRGLWTRSSECWPPFQWMTSTISPAASSISTTISVISARTSRWRVLIVVHGALHAAERSSANPVTSGRTSSASDICIRSSRSRQRSTRCSAVSHASSSLRVPNPAVGVALEQRLIAFVLRPTDVALVLILDEYLPRTHRLAVAIALARTTIDDRGALLALAVSVDAGIEGILQNRDDVAIPDWPPFERCQRPAVRRIGKVDVLRRHPQQHLAGAAEFTKLLKDKPDHPLQPLIRIEAEADVPVPGVADRTRDPQLATLGFRSCSLVHPRSDDPQLELADTSLHAEQ